MGVPVYHGDFYSDDFILNPTQGYADLRAGTCDLDGTAKRLCRHLL